MDDLLDPPYPDLSQVLRSWRPSFGWVFDGVRSSYRDLGLGNYAFPCADPANSFEHKDITFSGVTGGTFTLTMSGNTTAAITWSATASTLATNIDTAIEALPTVGAGKTTVASVDLSGGNGTVSVIFSGSGAVGTDFPTMTADGSGLTGTSPTVTVTTVSDGGRSWVQAPGVAGRSAIRTYGNTPAVASTSGVPASPTTSLSLALLFRFNYPAFDGIRGPASSGASHTALDLFARRRTNAEASWGMIVSSVGSLQVAPYSSAGTSVGAAGVSGDYRFDSGWRWFFGWMTDTDIYARTVSATGRVASNTGTVTGTWNKPGTGSIAIGRTGAIGLSGDVQAALGWTDRILTAAEMDSIAAQTLVGMV